MTTLNPLQLQILTPAAETEEGCLAPTEDTSTAKAKTAIKALIKSGLMISVPVQGEASRLLITQAGRDAIQPPPASAAPTDPKGKLGAVIGLLRQPDGATIEALMAATGWQAHSVRGALSGAIKKARGLTVTSEKTEAGRTYRIVTP